MRKLVSDTKFNDIRKNTSKKVKKEGKFSGKILKRAYSFIFLFVAKISPRIFERIDKIPDTS